MAYKNKIVKRKTVETDVIDTTTGEINTVSFIETEKEETTIFTSKYSPERFWLMYTDMISKGEKDIPNHGAKRIFSWLLGRFSGFDHSIALLKELKEEISKDLNLSMNSIKEYIKQLADCNYIIKMSRACYIINPKLAWKGTSADREKKIKILIEQNKLPVNHE
jgi:predicted KAP-like P-loop ATPase